MSLFSSVAESSKIEKLMPRTLGLIRPNTNNNKILDASNFCMGDKYAKVLCSGVKLTLDYYEQLNLKNNNLTSRSSECLNQLIPTKLKGLNLQGNSLGQGGQEFVKALNTRYGQLQYLNLENNKFNDDGCRQLFKMLQENTIMQKLNLSHNLITDKSMPEFNMLLQKNATLSEIYLHWNRIHQIGGQYIIAALFINYNVKVLDLSFNSLGIFKFLNFFYILFFIYIYNLILILTVSDIKMMLNLHKRIDNLIKLGQIISLPRIVILYIQISLIINLINLNQKLLLKHLKIIIIYLDFIFQAIFIVLLIIQVFQILPNQQLNKKMLSQKKMKNINLKLLEHFKYLEQMVQNKYRDNLNSIMKFVGYVMDGLNVHFSGNLIIWILKENHYSFI